MDLQGCTANELLYVSFNQDFTCFVCGTETGFRVYSSDPFRQTYRRDFGGGGLGVIAMLHRSNILAFAGGGLNPRYQPHKVILWDDVQLRAVAELTFRSAVRSVRLRDDLVLVCVDRKVYLYRFRCLTLLDSIESVISSKGLCSLSCGNRTVVACLGMQLGQVLLVFYPHGFGESPTITAREQTTVIQAHDSSIAAMSLDAEGTLLATASEKGTIVRIFDAVTGSRLQELRRGVDQAEIHSLAFSPAVDWLAVSSDKGTVHVFSVQSASGIHTSFNSDVVPENARSSLRRLKGVLPVYFSSEWSFAQFRVQDSRCIAAFGAEANTLVVVCANGQYHKARFDPIKGGAMVREELVEFHDASISNFMAVDGDLVQASSCSIAQEHGALPAEDDETAGDALPPFS